MNFLWSVDNKASKTAFFATIFTGMVVFMFPFAWYFEKPYPDLTAELLGVLWISYVGSNKVQQWVAAKNDKKKNDKPSPTTPPDDKDQIPRP